VLIDRARSWLCIALLVVLCVLPPASARASMLVHEDLTSLALESDAIVLARITGHRAGEWRNREYTHEVVESHFGELAPGDVIEIDYGSNRLPMGRDNEEVGVADEEVVLFLERGGVGGRAWSLRDSGLRIFVDGSTYRFEQGERASFDVAVPQGHDPYDVFEDPRGREPLTRSAFESELRAAIERAAAVRRDLAAIESPEARARLLEVIGPVWGTDDDEPCVLDGTWRFDDRVSEIILEQLWAAGEREALLEGYSRLRGGVAGYRLEVLSRASWLLASASERERPVHLRVAALQLLAEDRWSLRDPSVVESLVPLLEDPEPSIRAAAAFWVPEEGATRRWQKAIVKRLRVESEPNARYALVEVAIQHDLLTEARLPDESWPVVMAERCGRALAVRWISPGPPPGAGPPVAIPYDLETLTVTARPVRGEPQTLQLVPSAGLQWRSSDNRRGQRHWLFFDEPLPDGRAELELVAVLRQDQQTREVRLDLRPLGVPPPSAPPSEVEATPVPAGCACTASGSPAGSFAWLLILVGLAARRHRVPCVARRSVVLVVLCLMCLVPQTSRAAMMAHYDLTSLALESDAIVLARITGTQESLRTHAVIESYFGGLAPGDVIEVDYASMSFATGWGDEDTLVFDDEVVLFLERGDDGQRPWKLVGSGLRIFVDGITYRFEQGGNPGPYVPVPQGHDPYDVFEDPRGREPLTRAAFQLELRAAIERAAGVRRDLAAIDFPEARARLLEVIGPAWGTNDDEPCVVERLSFFVDRVSVTILRELWAAGEREAFLEGYSRVRGGVDDYRLQVNIEAGWLLVSASERERPLHLRVAALQLLADDRSSLREPGVADSLVALLEDLEPSIRAAAAISVSEEDATPSWRAAIVERLRVESDPHARYALVEVALEHELLAEAGLPGESWPVVMADRCGRALAFRWISSGQTQGGWLADPYEIEALTVTARPTRGEPQTLESVANVDAGWWISGSTRGLRHWLVFDEPLPEGRVDLELVAVLRRGEQTREVRLDLRPLGLAPALAKQVTLPPPSEVEATPVPAGCACTATGSPVGSFAWLLILVGFAARRYRGPCVTERVPAN
jgi:MYXO-CTERM domain-containing protein